MSVSYDWVVVGGGIAGISIAEILTREGRSVLLLEKGERLAGGTSGDLHEWVHTGCLYTLLPDRLVTMKYLLGAIDDLLDYYSGFPGMNAFPTEQGIVVGEDGWFEPKYIHFRYRNRRFNPVWALGVARARFLISRLACHDWLRRRAGGLDEFRTGRARAIWANLCEQAARREPFLEVRSTDFCVNSRLLLRDLLAAGLANGLEVRTGQRVLEIGGRAGARRIVTDAGELAAERVVLCVGEATPEFVPVKVTTSYAPMAVVAGLPDDARSFVELDANVRNCINLLVKRDGLGLVGGISLKRRAECEGYLDRVIERHRAHHRSISVLGRYVSVKSEITFPREDRNYLFHIVDCGDGLWTTIPGKFTLGFSLAPEFYRRVYHVNPRKHFRPAGNRRQAAALIADTRWEHIAAHAGARSAAA